MLFRSKTVLSMDQIRTCLAIREEICTPEKGYSSFVRFLDAALVDDSALPEPDDTGEEARALLHTIAVAIAHKIRLDVYFRQMEEAGKNAE